MEEEKSFRGYLPAQTYYKDELTILLERYTPEQIKEILESVTPKLTEKDLKIPIYYGTKERF